MSGGTDEFYYKIGYKKGYELLYLEKSNLSNEDKKDDEPVEGEVVD